jgi:hypothetical protein
MRSATATTIIYLKGRRGESQERSERDKADGGNGGEDEKPFSAFTLQIEREISISIQNEVQKNVCVVLVLARELKTWGKGEARNFNSIS